MSSPNKGQFQPGHKNSQGTRSKKDIELEAHARLHAKYAIDVAAQILMNEDAPNQDRLKAAQMILDRGHGKPKEHVTVSHERPVTEWSEAELDAAIASLVVAEGKEGKGSSQTKPDPVH